MINLKKFMRSYTHRPTSIRFQVISIMVSLSLMLLLFVKALQVFTSTDPRPDLQTITPQKQTEVGGATATVKTGLYIRSFHTFDITNNDFIADVILWFEFDPTAISLETVEKFSFEKGTILYKSPPNTKLIDGNLLARFELRVQFTSNLDYRFFPFSDHRLYIVLTNKFITPSEMVFSVLSSSFVIPDDIYAAGWLYKDRNVLSGYTLSRLDAQDAKKSVSHPRVIFSIDFEKSGLRQIFLIIIPILLMYFMALFALSLDPKIHTRVIMTLVIGSISSLLAYRFVIEKMSPSVGYFTISDNLYTFILTATFLVFLISAYSVRSGKLSPMLNVIRVACILILHSALILTTYYLLFMWQK